MTSNPEPTDDSHPARQEEPGAGVTALNRAPGATLPGKDPIILRQRHEPPRMPSVEEDARAAAYLRGPTAFCA
ncbi:MAG TPA: hypothetical protein VFS03_01000 [Microvirga sp.]|nr:hypothetical protein [Microvirga sp.]